MIKINCDVCNKQISKGESDINRRNLLDAMRGILIKVRRTEEGLLKSDFCNDCTNKYINLINNSERKTITVINRIGIIAPIKLNKKEE